MVTLRGYHEGHEEPRRNTKTVGVGNADVADFEQIKGCYRTLIDCTAISPVARLPRVPFSVLCSPFSGAATPPPQACQRA